MTRATLLCGILLLVACFYQRETSKRLKFEGKEWVFPLRVGEAVREYNLKFKPPGYYYLSLPSGGTMWLEFLTEQGDFYDEKQSENALYDRKVSTYIFSYNNRRGLFDSLRESFEQTTEVKMTAVIDTRQIDVAGRRVMTYPVAYWKATLADSMIIALRQLPSFKSQREFEGKIEVFLFGEEPKYGVVSRLRAF